MKRIYLITLLVVLVVGCYDAGGKDEGLTQHKWAVVNIKLLEQKISIIAKRNNPYTGRKVVRGSELSYELERLSDKIHHLKADVIKKCMWSRKKLPQGKKQVTTPQGQPGGAVSSGLTSRERVVIPERVRYDKACLKRAESDPRVTEIKKKKRKIDVIVNMQSEHESRLKKLSRDYARKLIAQYAKSKYEMVVSRGIQNIPYDAGGLKLDITKALISEIDESKLVLQEHREN